MKIELKRSEFLEKINTAIRFTSHKIGTPQSLQSALLKCKDGEMEICSTNLSYYYQTLMKTGGKGDKNILLDLKKVQEFLSLLEQEEIIAEIEERQMILSQGKTRGTFPVLAGSDFPSPPNGESEEVVLETSFFEKNLPAVLFSSSRDDSRPVLSGVNFISSGPELLMVSTDGFRLSLLKIANKDSMKSMLVPSEFLYEVLQQIKREKTVKLISYEKEKAICVRVGQDRYYSRLIEGEFPPFEKVIPAESRTVVRVDGKELLRNIKIVAVFARDQSNIILCEFKKDGLWMTPKTNPNNGNSTQIDIEMKGEEQKTAFNYKFLVDFLSSVGDASVSIEILRSDAPVVFRTEKYKDLLHIIMPVRIQE